MPIHRTRNPRPNPCAFCGAPDDRRPDHAQGCPRFPPLSKDELIRIARAVEQGWAERDIRERQRAAEREQARATAAYREYLRGRKVEAAARRAGLSVRAFMSAVR